MANSRFQYVRKFEQPDPCLPNCWPVVRVDGKNFHKFATQHKLAKPNDLRLIELMTSSARDVMAQMKDVVVAYGQSDEYSFVFRKSTETYKRRASKLSSVVVSQFSSSFVFNWSKHFTTQPLLFPPAFDSRLVLYPSDTNLRDYLSWRQVDCHINNLYNTCFWKLVESGRSPREAEDDLKGTLSADKNELLFSRFGINYNNIDQVFRKGTTLVRPPSTKKRKTAENGDGDVIDPTSSALSVLHVDIIGTSFWDERPHLLAS